MPSSILAPELIDLLRHSLEHVAGSGDVVVDTNTPLDYCRVSFGSRLPNKLYFVYPDHKVMFINELILTFGAGMTDAQQCITHGQSPKSFRKHIAHLQNLDLRVDFEVF